MMQLLRDIAEVVTRYRRTDRGEDQFFAAGSKCAQLFRFAAADAAETQPGPAPDDARELDARAAALIYDDAPTARPYITLKSEVMRHAQRMLLFLDVRRFPLSDRGRAIYRCERRRLVVNLLQRCGAHVAAEALAASLRREARKHELWRIAVCAGNVLRRRAALDGDEERFESLTREINSCLEVDGAEVEAREMAESIIVRFSRSAAPDFSLAREAREYRRRLEMQRRRHSSYTLRMYCHRLHLLEHEIVQDYAGVLRVCDEFDAWLAAGGHSSNARRAELHLTRLYCCLFLRKYERGRRHVRESLRELTEGDYNWFALLELNFLLEMHAGEYRAAAEVYRCATARRRQLAAYPQRLEKWRIFEAYLRFACEAGRIDIPEPESLFAKKFNIYGFVNDLPVFSRDKRGYNVAITIAHFLFLLRYREFDALLDRAAILETYNSTWLRQRSHARSHCFVRLLLTVLYRNFDAADIQRRAGKHLDRLAAIKPLYDGAIDGVEVIPYEHLWTLVMRELQAIDREGWFVRVHARGEESGTRAPERPSEPGGPGSADASAARSGQSANCQTTLLQQRN